MAELSDFYKNEEYEKVVDYIKKARLETLKVTYIMSKIFGKLHEKNKVEELYYILFSIANYDINVMNDELTEGLRLLLSAREYDKVLTILETHLKKNKKIDEYVVSMAFSECFLANSSIDKLFKLFLFYYSQNQNISHSFWQSTIENLVKKGYQKEANELLSIYPIKYSFSESLFKVIIKEKIKFKASEEIICILCSKFESRNVQDDLKTYENIFSILLSELTDN